MVKNYLETIYGEKRTPVTDYPKKLITKEKIGIRKTIKKIFKILTHMVCLPLTIILIFIFYVIALLKK